MYKIINKKLKSKKGFTLVELLVVLAVLAIISAIAVPKFAGVQDAAKLSADYATGEMIARAADIYLAVNATGSGESTVNLEDLTSGGKYLENKAIKIQSEGIEVNANNSGTYQLEIKYKNYSVIEILVKKGAAVVMEIYPRP